MRIWNSVDIHYKNGAIIAKWDGRTISLDSTRRTPVDLAFLSHAHFDHLTSHANTTVLASEATAELASLRGMRFNNSISSSSGLKLIDNGHILGSRALLIGNDTLYTGDFAGRARGFLPKFDLVKCKTLIIEATYGKRGMSFPPTRNVIETAMNRIASAYESGNGIMLQGYALGKAQLLTYIFKTWRPMYIHPKVEEINTVYRKFGIDIPKPDGLIADVSKLPQKTPFVYIAPMNISSGDGITTLKFTGWARGTSKSSLPLSDHADYNELLEYVKNANPERVLTVYGFDRELARELCRQGFRAKALSELQTNILDFI